jgi:hypothetical protein
VAFTPDEAAARNSHYLNVVARLAPGVTLESYEPISRGAAERLRAPKHANLGLLPSRSKSDLLKREPSALVRSPGRLPAAHRLCQRGEPAAVAGAQPARAACDPRRQRNDRST